VADSEDTRVLSLLPVLFVVMRDIVPFVVLLVTT
jgi:hypothetical protein